MEASRKKYYLLLLPLLLVGAVIYFFWNPAEFSWFPKCPFYSITGYYCPGCGSQRAIHQLLHGNILAAANYNLMLVAVLPLLFYHLYLKITNALFNKNRYFTLWYSPTFTFGLTFVILLFWILRNVPAPIFSFLQP